MGPQFLLVLQLVLLDEPLVHIKGLPTCICKLPLVTAKSKWPISRRKWQLRVKLLRDSATWRRYIPTQKSLPEDFLQKFYLVVRVSLCIGFFKKSSGIGHRPSINLLGRRDLAEDHPISSLDGAFSTAGRRRTNHADPNPLTEPGDLMMHYLSHLLSSNSAVSSWRMNLSAALHGHPLQTVTCPSFPIFVISALGLHRYFLTIFENATHFSLL